MSTTIKFYKVNYDEHTLHTPPTSANATHTGNIFDPLNIVNPSVEVNYENIEQYNLIQIAVNSNRFYWIKEYEYIGEGHACILHCESAVLLNWYTQICNSNAVIENSKGYYNKQFVSNDFPILAQRQFNNINTFKQIPYQDCYVITTLGGDS